jgi:ABC-2 type transport system permease protein
LSGLVVGVYYPPELLPSPLQLLSKIFPHTYGLEGIRLVMQNGETLGSPNIIWIIGVLVIFSIILLPLGIALFSAGIRKAERDGTLARWV